MKLKLKCVMQTANEMKTEKVASTKIVGDVGGMDFVENQKG